ncbi:hypothetical protein H4R34_000902 [Dimargaris verticillata]|uniref:carnosine N-methyltransferase n=1 Tax=Dimargaris verticillata TaxID=2761393 RepID=A0A9W8BCE3_9FUNG|nr:hypothetical protein H4R34_000902 [Dimargaris verticillata]
MTDRALSLDSTCQSSPDSAPATNNWLDQAATDNEEHQHFLEVLSALVFYRTYALHHYHRAKLSEFDRLSSAHQQLLREAGYLVKLLSVEQGIRANARFLNRIVHCQVASSTSQSLDVLDASPGEPAPKDSPEPPTVPPALRQIQHMLRDNQHQGKPPVPEYQMDKLRSTLRQLVRDWSAEGQAERNASYGLILDMLEQQFPKSAEVSRAQRQVLVPGAGLGRLALEIAHRGFSCQGNEFSSFMLFVSDFILNRTQTTGEFEVHPFVHAFSNHVAIEDQVRGISIPDVLPRDQVPDGVDFSMTAGDFLEIYGQDSTEQGAWDAVITCFFIDTANNIVTYLETIYKILRPGGIWINLGPLLYHFENIEKEPSIELTLQEVLSIAKSIGFTISNERYTASPYTGDTRSMLIYSYQCAFFTATK